MTENTFLDKNTSSIIKKEGIPKLRFSEFDALWKQIPFSDIFDILQNNTYARADLNYKIENTKNIHYGDILVKFNEYVDVQNNNVPFINNEKNLSKFKSESYLRDGDIIIADTAEDETVGKVTEISNTNEQKVLSGLHTIPCRPKRKFAPMFLGFYMNSESFHKQLIPLITGIKVSSISKTSIATTTISVPLFEEQEKISKFMIAINNMIKEQESNISILETYNRGLISQVFKQEIRFKDDNGNEFPDWTEKTFEELADYKKGPFGSALKKEIFVPKSNTTIKVYEQQHAIEKDCTIERYFITDKYYEKMKSFSVKEGDIIISCAGTIGEIYVLPSNAEDGIINQALMRVRINNNVVDKKFFITLFDNMISTKGKKLSNGSALKNIPPFADLKKQIALVPCLKEQEKIANFLTSLDNVLQEEKNYLEYLKTIKKGLLQQMFV